MDIFEYNLTKKRAMAVKWITLSTFWKAVFIGVGIFLFIWLLLSLYVRRQGEALIWEIGDTHASNRALLLYNPDPFYNLDEQLCKTFATTLSDYGWYAEVRTIRAAAEADLSQAGLLVFCSNTYNWAPDKATVDFINEQSLASKNCVAITLGAGSTDRAQRLLEEALKARGASLLGSRAYWLWRPNAEPRVVAPNVHIAKLMVAEFAQEIMEDLK